MRPSQDSFERSFTELQSLLGYSLEKLSRFRVYGTNEASVLGFLSRYLNAAGTAEAAVAKLSSRRHYERTLPSLSVTPGIITVLRSGAFRVLGRDVQGRVILYVHARHLGSLSGLEMDEAQRLFILLMEYLQFLSAVVGSASPPHPGSVTTNSPTRAGGKARKTALPSPGKEMAAAQEVLVLINEEGVEWHTQQSLVTRVEGMFSLLMKFYPGLIGLTLFVGAGVETREGIQNAYAGLRASFSPPSPFSLEFISRSTLSQYIPGSVLPIELGGSSSSSTIPGGSWTGEDDGSNKSMLPSNGKCGSLASPSAAFVPESPAEFSELVLRQWYTLTSFLLEEEAVLLAAEHQQGDPISETFSSPLSELKRPLKTGEGSPSSPVLYRPLYLLPPHRVVLSFYANSIGFSRLTGLSLPSRVAGGYGRQRRPLSHHHRDPSLFSPAASLQDVPVAAADDAFGVETHGDGDEDYEEDDGLCSLATDLEGSFTMERTERFLRQEMVDAGSPMSGAQLRAAYRVECAMRKAAEQRLEAARVQAIPIPCKNAERIEQVLISLHQEVNQLIGDILKRVLLEQQSRVPAQGSRLNTTPACSLELLLDTTIAALGVAAGVPAAVPASLSAASVVERMEKEEKDCCCCCC